MKKLFLFISFLLILSTGCKVTFITGYDQVLDETIMRMKNDFNLHFIRLSRTIQDNDPDNQKFENFLAYYDQLTVDTLMLHERVQYLGNKSAIVQQQVQNINNSFRKLMEDHKHGFADRPGDDRHDIRDAINSAINAVILLQEELRTTGKLK